MCGGTRIPRGKYKTQGNTHHYDTGMELYYMASVLCRRGTTTIFLLLPKIYSYAIYAVMQSMLLCMLPCAKVRE